MPSASIATTSYELNSCDHVICAETQFTLRRVHGILATIRARSDGESSLPAAAKGEPGSPGAGQGRHTKDLAEIA